jgi:hypothetical protein
MITWTVEAILGLLFAVVVMQFFKHHPSQPAAPTGPVEDLANLKPSDARVGDVISVSGAGDNMEDLDFTIDRSASVNAGTRYWMEMGGDYKNRRVAMRVGGDEELEVAVHNDPRKLTIEDLGLSEDDLASMDERQNTGDNFGFDGKNFLYVLSREGQSQRSDRPQPEGFYYWEFREEGGKGIMALRKTQGDPFAVTLWNGIPASDITVYRGKS